MERKKTFRFQMDLNPLRSTTRGPGEPWVGQMDKAKCEVPSRLLIDVTE